MLLAYSLLTVALTWPLATQFTTTLPDGNDSWRYLWNLWWAKMSLLDLHTDFFYTTYLYYPNGINLYVDTPTPLLGAIGIPLQLLGLNLVTVYNLLLALSFVLAGYGTYLLVRYLTGSGPAAFISGIIFAFCPYHFAQMLGHLNIASIQWIPFYVLALFKALEQPGAAPPLPGQTAVGDGQKAVAQPLPSDSRSRVLWAAMAGVWLAVVSYTEWTYTLFLLMFTVWYLFWKLVVRPRLHWRACLAGAGTTLLVWLVLVAPVLLPMLQEARSAGYGQASLNDAAFFGSDVTDAFVPSLFHPLWSTLGLTMNERWQTRPRPEKFVFAGYTVLAIAAVSVIVLRQQRKVLFWGLTALGTWVLSLGPIVYFWGEHIFFGHRIPLPYSLLYYAPFFNIMRVPSRFTVLVMLALAVLVGYGLAAASAARAEDLSTRRRTKDEGRRSTLSSFVFRPSSGRGRLFWVVGALVIFEYLAVPYPMQVLNYDEPVYHEIAREPGQFGIVDLPLTQLPIYEGYQTIHGKPIVDGYLARNPPDPFVDNTPVLRYLRSSTKIDDPIGAQAANEGVAELRAANIRYVIVHEWPWTANTDEQVTLRAKLARVFPGVKTRVVSGHQTTITIFQIMP